MMSDSEHRDFILLEADYWKQMLDVSSELTTELQAINQELPECITNPTRILVAQQNLLRAIERNRDQIDLIRGRATFLERHIDEL